MPARSTIARTPAAVSRFAERSIHLVGIGGCGMSGLARMLHELGASCQGSEFVPNDLTAQLERDGITVYPDHDAGHLPETCNLVIASAAIRPDHPEVTAADRRGIPVVTYAEALGQLQAERTGISIAGTHGKSTTTAMLCHLLIEAGLDPSFIVGAVCDQIGGGCRSGRSSVPSDGPYAGRPGLLVAEACEFNRSFHHHRPTLGLINNVEEDHLDVYGSLENVVAAFGDFAALLPAASEDGYLLIAHEGGHRREICARLTCAVETFGYSPEADFQVTYDPSEQRAELRADGRTLASWLTPLPGAHNALNAAAAAILAQRVGASWSDVERALGTFRGLERRMQRLGSRAVPGGSVTVYDDYGHHPTEIDQTLRALRATERPERVVCVFQPHQHSRTRFLLDEFAQSFASADLVIVPHIYFVRDSEIEKHRVSVRDLVDRLRERSVAAMHVYPFEAITEQLEILCRPNDLLVIMGAGPVWRIAHDFVRAAGASSVSPT